MTHCEINLCKKEQNRPVPKWKECLQIWYYRFSTQFEGTWLVGPNPQLTHALNYSLIILKLTKETTAILTQHNNTPLLQALHIHRHWSVLLSMLKSIIAKCREWCLHCHMLLMWSLSCNSPLCYFIHFILTPRFSLFFRRLKTIDCFLIATTPLGFDRSWPRRRSWVLSDSISTRDLPPRMHPVAWRFLPC